MLATKLVRFNFFQLFTVNLLCTRDCQAKRVLVSIAETKKFENMTMPNASQGAGLEQNRQLIPRLGSYACATLSPLLLLTINRIGCLAIVLGLLHGLGCGSQLSLLSPP